jgi:3-hydroxyacyl-CoA dehydrogenase
MLQLAKNYKPPEPLKLNLPGLAGYAALNKIIEEWRVSGKASPYDVTVLKALTIVLCGEGRDASSPVAEEQLLELECREFMKLTHLPETTARIQHMLNTGKPLRN